MLFNTIHSQSIIVLKIIDTSINKTKTLSTTINAH